jgi:hypothetical protein
MAQLTLSVCPTIRKTQPEGSVLYVTHLILHADRSVSFEIHSTLQPNEREEESSATPERTVEDTGNSTRFQYEHFDEPEQVQLIEETEAHHGASCSD